MKKLWTIAVREYRAVVGTKAFLISIVMMPIMMFGGLLAMNLMNRVTPTKEHRILIHDATGQLFDLLKKSADQHNEMVRQSLEGAESGGKEKNPFEKSAILYLETTDFETFDDQKRLTLSDAIRNKELYAFVEIPEDVFDNPTASVAFCAEGATLSQEKRWIQQNLSRITKQHRLEKSGVDMQVVEQASIPVRVNGIAPWSKNKEGEATLTESKDELTAIFLPMGTMMLMFMVIFLAAQPAMESVFEEKSQRIAEVLLGSANPFQLMLGKLLGVVGGSLTIFSIYLIGAFVFAQQRGYLEHLSISIVPWFVAFQICGVLFYASIFMSVGAAVSQLKEAQSMLLPVWMLMMFPMFVWFNVVRDPNSTFATFASLFPPATSTMMILRLATGMTIPLWQLIVGLVLLIASTGFCVFLSGRIFRTGLLWQGKTPKVIDLLRWAFGQN